MKTKHSAILSLVALTFCTGLVLAYEVGDTCFSKQASTPLLASADREAAKVGSVSWGKPLKITEMNGRWLKVSGNGEKGWIYSGNVSSQKPPSENKNDFLPSMGADTSAAVASRPLSESSKQFAARKSLGSAAADVEWAEHQADKVTRSQVDAYMKEKGLGDYAK